MEILTGRKVPVTERAIVQRLNRRLAHDYESIKTPRGERNLQSLGRFYLLNTYQNWIMKTHIDPESFARDLGVMAPWEVVI
jgi:hypothetical protein